MDGEKGVKDMLETCSHLINPKKLDAIKFCCERS